MKEALDKAPNVAHEFQQACAQAKEGIVSHITSAFGGHTQGYGQG